MISPEMAPPTTKFIGFALIGLILVVFGLGIPGNLSYDASIVRHDAELFRFKQDHPNAKDEELPQTPAPPLMLVLALALGTLLPISGGVVAGALALATALKNRSHATGDANFSSLSPDLERAFVPHEKRLLATRNHANLVGAVGGAGLTVVIMGIFFVFYTPCSRLCERPPASCKTSEQATQFRRICETNCANLRAQRGTEFVETLTACASAGATDKKCAEPTKAGVAAGLACESK